MKLIAEEAVEVRYLVEDKNGKKEHFIEDIFMQAEQKNRNGRIYPRNILERKVGRYNQEYVQKNRAFGERRRCLQ